MISIIAGVVFILFAFYAVFPIQWGLQWWEEVVMFLKGGAPVVAFLLGLLFLLVGAMVIKDRMRVRKEEKDKS